VKLITLDTSFCLTILGYQYPDAAGEPYDANWLSIHIEATGPTGAWSGTDPCLLTYEAALLVNWLQSVAAGSEFPPAISFLEPVLLFRLVKTARGKTLRVHFGNLINPSWQQQDANTKHGHFMDLWLDFPLSETDLTRAAESLRQQLKRYPDRAEH
jgi:hypothetical protein